jgi:hypothetical protein
VERHPHKPQIYQLCAVLRGLRLPLGTRIPHPATIGSKSFTMSNKWYGSLWLALNVKCS